MMKAATEDHALKGLRRVRNLASRTGQKLVKAQEIRAGHGAAARVGGF